MGNSAPVTITVLNSPTYVTLFANHSTNPVSEALPFNIEWDGFLSRTSGGIETDPIVDGETIIIQIQDAAGNWQDTGVHAVTGPEPGTPTFHGFFDAVMNFTETSIPPGNWSFRAYYAGNSTKGLLGC